MLKLEMTPNIIADKAEDDWDLETTSNSDI